MLKHNGKNYVLRKDVVHHFQNFYDWYLKTYFKKNVTVVGSPTFNNGVVSGFSSSNYLMLPQSYNPSTNSVELGFKITTGDDVTTTQRFVTVNDKYCFTLGITSGKFCYHFSSNGASWNLANQKECGSVTANTVYYIKLTTSTEGTELSYSATGEPDSYISDWTSTSQLYGSTDMIVKISGNMNATNAPWLGSIDLSEYYIKINGEYWWRGVESGTDLTDYDWEESELVSENTRTYDGEYTSNVLVSQQQGTQDDYDEIKIEKRYYTLVANGKRY